MAISYQPIRRTDAPVPALTEDQLGVVGHRQGALLVLGGARTGKTTALIEAAVAALRDGAYVLFLAGSRGARLDLRARVGTAHPQLVDRLTVTTFYSFCQSVVGRFGGSPDVSVLSATRQDAYVRQILAGQASDAWSERFDRARGLDQFAVDVREAVAACQRDGLTPRDVRRRGVAEGRDDWVGLARFYQEYLDILGLAGVMDYPELLIRARQLLDDESVLSQIRPAGSLIVVDDLEDIDPTQAEIVLGLVDATTPIILAGNPDAQIYGFRGARARSTGELLEALAGRGIDTSVIALDHGYQVAEAVQQACAGLVKRIPLPAGIELGALEVYRHPQPDRTGEVVKMVFADPSDEADQIAWLLKQAHRGQHLPYDQMAILVRKKDSFERYALACQRAGVPVVVSGDEIQLNREEIAMVAMAALRVVRDGAAASAEDWRRVGESPLGVGDEGSRLDQVIDAGRARMNGSAVEVLWAIWRASTWQDELLAQVEAGDPQPAHRALDAAVALFALAAKFSDLPADKGISALDAAVNSQEVPEDLPRSSSWTASAVRLTTAHRAKGHTWSLVVVAGVEEGVWPPDRPPSAMVPVAGLSSRLVEVPQRQRMAAERRLLYAGCAAASRRLVVTAVDDDDRTPSAFFDQLDADTVLVSEVAPLPLTGAGLVGQLRQVAADEAGDGALRQGACDRLALLSDQRVFPGADPARWWSVGASPGEVVADPGGTQLVLSASQVESLLECPRRWYLSRRVLADRPVSVRTRIGSLLHGLVQDCEASLEDMEQALAAAWPDLDFPAGWMPAAEWESATTALARFDAWRQARPRQVLATELPVDFLVDLGRPVRVKGRIDLVERDSAGRIWIIDHKTGQQAPTRAQAGANVQIGLYQLAVRQGGLTMVTEGAPLGGAELVYLRLDESSQSRLPKVFVQPSLELKPHLDGDRLAPTWLPDVGDQWQYPTWVHHRLALAAAVISQSQYPGVAGSTCRFCSFARGCPAANRGKS